MRAPPRANATSSFKPQARKFTQFDSLLFGCAGQMSNSVSYLPVPKQFTASRSHARQRYARPLLSPLLFRPGLYPHGLRHREGLESKEAPTRSGCMGCIIPVSFFAFVTFRQGHIRGGSDLSSARPDLFVYVRHATIPMMRIRDTNL